jgi:O-antigen/teichoic acid export membrane protein
LHKRLSVQFLSQILLALSQVAFTLVTYPIITKAFGANGLGQVNFIDSISQFLIIISSLGIPILGVRDIAINKENRVAQSNTFSQLLSLQLLFTFPAVLLMWLIGMQLDVNGQLVSLAIINILASSLTCDWFFQGNESFVYIAIRSICIRVLGVLAIFIFVNKPDDIFLYYTILVGSVVLTAALNFHAILKQITFSTHSLNIKTFFKNFSWVYCCYLSISVYTLLDTVLLGLLSDHSSVGYYSLGYRVVRLSTMIIISLGAVFIPRIALKYAKGSKQQLNEEIDLSQQIIFFTSLPMCLAFFILAPEIVDVLSKSNFSPTISVIRILCLLPLLISFSHLTGMQIMIPLKKEKILFFMLLAGCFTSVLLNMLLVPLLKEKAAALSNLITEGVITISSSVYLIKKGILKIAVNSILTSIFYSLPIVPIAYVFKSLHIGSIWTIIFTALISATVYIVLQLRFQNNSIIQKVILFK